MKSVSKLFANEMLEFIDAKHKEALKRCDYQFRALKENVETWASGDDVYGYIIEQLSSEHKEEEENLKQLMDELRAD